MTVAEIIVLTASYYRIPLSEPVLAMYCEDLEDYPPDQVIAAYKAYRRDPKNKNFPLPGAIVDMISPTPNPEAEARELLGRVKNAITQFGYMQGDAARTYVGEVGWQIVRDSGGWFNLCNSDFLINDSMQAQARNRLLDLVKYGPALKLIVDNKIKISNEERLQIEANRQKEDFAKHQAKQIEAPKRIDPNADYIAKTPEERDAIIQQFLKNIKQV